MSYGLREYKELLEKALASYNDPMSCPFGMDPLREGAQWRLAKQEAFLYALEMLPEVPE